MAASTCGGKKKKRKKRDCQFDTLKPQRLREEAVKGCVKSSH